jgi:hypothetical protein
MQNTDTVPNTLIANQYPILEMYQALRSQLMKLIADDDLGYTTGGDNPTLGALCREIGEVQQSYIDSFRNFIQDFSWRNEEPGIESSVEKLVTWYDALDVDMKTAVAALSDKDISNREIDRGDFSVGPTIQLHIYREALLIFYGKASVYLKALGKPFPRQWAEWIG